MVLTVKAVHFVAFERTYGRQVACDSGRLHQENHRENQLRFSNSKHFRFY